MLDAEKIARQDEKAVILEGHAARSACRIERKERRGDDAGLQPICPLGPERLCWGHQRFAAVEPPQVKEAVMKKFQRAAMTAPPSPATQ